MRPDLLEFTLGGTAYVLRAYSTFYTLAFVLAPLVAVWVAHRRGLSWRRALAVYAGALLCGIVGARVLDLYIAGAYYAQEPSRMWSTNFAGFSLYGGLVVATVAGIALARAMRLGVWRLADSAVPALVLGQVLMRAGCFCNGCCFGEVTSAPWGVTFQAGTPAWSHQLATGAGGFLGTLLGEVKPVHPTQLYEVAGALVAGGVAWWLLRRRTPDGVPFLAYALGFTLVRLGNGFLRARTNVITAPEWFYPAFYLALAVVLAALLVWRRSRGPENPDAAHPPSVTAI